MNQQIRVDDELTINDIRICTVSPPFEKKSYKIHFQFLNLVVIMTSLFGQALAWHGLAMSAEPGLVTRLAAACRQSDSVAAIMAGWASSRRPGRCLGQPRPAAPESNPGPE